MVAGLEHSKVRPNKDGMAEKRRLLLLLLLFGVGRGFIGVNGAKITILARDRLEELAEGEIRL